MWVRAGVVVAVALAAMAAGCGSDDEAWMVRPGGGGGPGGTTPGDAQPVDAGPDGSIDELAGVVCVVDDLRQPDTCPASAARVGVLVRQVGTVLSVRTDADGRFTFASDGAPAVLDVADDSANLVPARLRAVSDGALVRAPVVTRPAWTAIIESLGVTPADGTGSIVVYVQDAAVPATGVVFDPIPGATIAPFYDGGGPLVWRDTGGTGAAGVALLIDVQPGTYTVVGTAADLRTVTVAAVSVDADRVTFVRGRLTP